MLLLTGATGYLGCGIARELIARRQRFRILVRDPKRLNFVPTAAECEVAVGDLTDPSALRAALEGVDAVVHTAALVKMWVRDRRQFQRVNLDALQDFLQAADEAGVERFVYTSSFVALGPSADVQADESVRRDGWFADGYAHSKVRALDWIRAEGVRQFPIIVTFPGVIYGPGPMTEGNLIGGMIEQYLDGKFPGLLGSGEQRWSFAFNANVINAHLAALEKGKPGDEYVLAGDNRSLNDFFRILADFTHLHHSVRHLPFAVGKLVGATEVVRARLFGHYPQLTPAVVEIFKHDWVYSSAKAIRDLGYGVAPLEEGLMKTLSERTPPAIRRWPSEGS